MFVPTNISSIVDEFDNVPEVPDDDPLIPILKQFAKSFQTTEDCKEIFYVYVTEKLGVTTRDGFIKSRGYFRAIFEKSLEGDLKIDNDLYRKYQNKRMIPEKDKIGVKLARDRRAIVDNRFRQLYNSLLDMFKHSFL